MATPGAIGKDERKVMRVYLDNNLLGPNAEEHEAETEAFHAIEAEWLAGRWRLEWMVSRLTATNSKRRPTWHGEGHCAPPTTRPPSSTMTTPWRASATWVLGRWAPLPRRLWKTRLISKSSPHFAGWGFTSWTL